MTNLHHSASVSSPKPPKPQLDRWASMVEKENWRITQLPNGYYQTEVDCEGVWESVTRRKTLEDAELAIDNSIEYFERKLEVERNPTVIKTYA